MRGCRVPSAGPHDRLWTQAPHTLDAHPLSSHSCQRSIQMHLELPIPQEGHQPVINRGKWDLTLSVI